MKGNVTITRRNVITQPVEMYTPKRVREIDAPELRLAAYIGAKPSAVKRPRQRKHKSAR